MKIKLFYIFFTSIIGITACNGQVMQLEEKSIDWALQLDIPTKDALERCCDVKIKEIVRKQKDNLNPFNLYFYQNELYTGWACEIIPNNRHKFRYEQFENGKMIRRVSYYDNGQIDTDFRMKNCKNYGPSRMWLYNGKLYIDEFYIFPGLKHGIQRQWHDNGVLAKESKVEKGKLIYQNKFNRNGILISKQ